MTFLSIDWQQKFADFVVYAGETLSLLFTAENPIVTVRLSASNPWQFLYYVFLCLTPMFIISGYLAYRLAKDIERNEKNKRSKIHQNTNIAKLRRHAKRD